MNSMQQEESSKDVESLVGQVEKNLTISSADATAPDDTSCGQEKGGNSQASRGGKKGKKKQKWKALDLSAPSQGNPQSNPSSGVAHNQWRNPPRGHDQGPESFSGSNSTHHQYQGRSNSNQEYGSSHGYHERGSNIALSKALVTLLRHKKPYDIPVDSAGYASVSSILRHPQFQRFYSTEKDVYDIVRNDNKDRFEILGAVGNNFQIRATQGHSFKLDTEESGLELIVDPKQFPTIVHGTYQEAWRFIKKEGLRRMTRAYVHFAIGYIGETHVTSGMRNTCDIVIVLDMEKAMAGGLKFFASRNKVVLTEGDERGLVSPKYFKTVKKFDSKSQQFKDIDFVFEG